MCTVMPMIASGIKTESVKGLCNQQDTQRCISGRIGMDGNSVMISMIKRRKTMAEYIRKEDAVNALDRIFDNVPMELTTEILRLRRELRGLPSADVVPVEELKAEIYKLKHQSEQSFGNHDYYVGYISALSTVEGILAVMDREE